jgi:hypothetical protein
MGQDRTAQYRWGVGCDRASPLRPVTETQPDRAVGSAFSEKLRALQFLPFLPLVAKASGWSLRSSRAKSWCKELLLLLLLFFFLFSAVAQPVVVWVMLRRCAAPLWRFLLYVFFHTRRAALCSWSPRSLFPSPFYMYPWVLVHVPCWVCDVQSTSHYIPGWAREGGVHGRN